MKAAGLKRLRKKARLRHFEEEFPRGLKPSLITRGLTYGLKPVPFKNRGFKRVFPQPVKPVPFKNRGFG
jgi:hypothetical protein